MRDSLAQHQNLGPEVIRLCYQQGICYAVRRSYRLPFETGIQAELMLFNAAGYDAAGKPPVLAVKMDNMMPITTSVRVDTRITYLGRTLPVIILIYPTSSATTCSLRPCRTFVVIHPDSLPLRLFRIENLGVSHRPPNRLRGSARTASDFRGIVRDGSLSAPTVMT